MNTILNSVNMASVILLPGRVIQSAGRTLLRTVSAQIHRIVQGGEVLVDPGSALMYQVK